MEADLEEEPDVDADLEGEAEAVGVMLIVEAADGEETGEGDALTLMLVVQVAEGERVTEIDGLVVSEPDADEELLGLKDAEGVALGDGGVDTVADCDAVGVEVFGMK